MPFIAIYRADEGFKRAKKTINPEQLRSWALTIIKNYSQSGDQHIPPSQVPDYIQNLYLHKPEDVLIRRDNQNSTIVIFWGGGFFHWVIEVGDTNFSRPFENQFSEYRYEFEWTNGIYYSREAGWRLW